MNENSSLCNQKMSLNILFRSKWFSKVQYGTTCAIDLPVLYAFRLKTHFELEKI